MIRFWLFASRPRILLPKTQVLQYLTNYVRILDQTDNLHLRATSRTGQRINLPNLFDKLPVVLEIDTEKNRNAEHKLPMRYRIENIVTYILSELDHLFGMTAWAEPPSLATECQEILIAAIGVCTPDPGEAFLQVSAFQVILDYLINNRTKEAVLFLVALIIVCLELLIVIVQDVP
jgi:hypothetical protein